MKHKTTGFRVDPSMAPRARRSSVITMSPAKRSRSTTTAVVTKRKLTRRRTTLVRVPRSMGCPIPLRLRNTLTYSDVLGFTTNSVGMYWNGYRANSIYDPYAGVGGTQPRFFDQMQALYDHWYVYQSRIKIRPFEVGQPVTGQPTGLEIGCFINDDFTPTLSVYNDFLESPGYVSKTTSSSDVFNVSVRKTWKTKDVFGAAGSNNSLTRGDASSNPTEQSFFIVTALTSAGISPCSYLITIEYDVEWCEVKRQAQS